MRDLFYNLCMKKLFIVNKFIYAKSASEALRIEKKHKPDEVFLDGDWKRNNKPESIKIRSIGFKK